MINKVEICGVNTSKLKVLKESEKLHLLNRIKEGDKEARNLLVNGNLRLVLSVVQKFTNRGENLDDLFQVGCIGLIKSIDNFDTGQGVRFSTYAVPMNVVSRNNNRKGVECDNSGKFHRAVQCNTAMLSGRVQPKSRERFAAVARSCAGVRAANVV